MSIWWAMYCMMIDIFASFFFYCILKINQTLQHQHNIFMADPTFKGHPSYTGNPDTMTVKEFDEYPDITPLGSSIDANTGKPSGDVALMVAKWLRISEIIRKQSGSRGLNKTKTKLIYVTLPHPRSFYEDNTYMGIIDMLSKDMPPMVLIKGNCKPCLTEFMD